ncbi:lipid II flippase FtsW [bacterium BMS3Abin05]|nr:lipid II flippase FtsW [bacterium BMS3Abin05]GBE27086.1 lipid II flippase FtsW [bacterium BMS3Bbin03]HDK35519.1 cell division protein FtsW [Bacteroidota bacterium]HDZ11402.1 cell division protein FtsW [Bacteroidota bacterium]
MRDESKKYVFLLVLTFALICIGLVMVYSASHPIAAQKYGNSRFFLFRHFIRLVIGFIFLAIGVGVPYQKWVKFGRPALLVSFVLLLALLIPGPYQATLNKAHRWLRIAGVQFQPVDFVRIFVIFYLADVLTRKEELLGHFKKGLLPQLVVLGILLGLIWRQPDLGSMLILTILIGVLFIAGGIPIRFLAPSVVVFPVVFFLMHDYQRLRIMKFLNSVIHGEPVSYQVAQSLVALGKGGFLGVGLDNSTQKLHFLPEPFSDFIVSILGEEFGFLGILVVFTGILIVILIGYRIAQRARTKEGMLLAVGISSTIALYTFVNAGVVTSLLPTKGLPLPFISYGGSFQISILWGIGILVNIMRQSEENEEAVPGREWTHRARAAWVQK